MIAVLLIALACFPAAADDPASDSGFSATEQSAVIEKLNPSFVHVEYILKYDKGVAPKGHGWAEKCPNCGRLHVGTSPDDLVTQERPLEAAGFLVAPSQLITTDPMIHSRFIRNIQVRMGDSVTDAKITGYFQEHNALLLETNEPVAGATPLTFDSNAKPPYLAIGHAKADGAWQTTASQISTSVSQTEDGRFFIPVSLSGVIVDRSAAPVALAVNNKLPADNIWKGSPLAWPIISANEMANHLKSLEQWCDRGILRVRLSFRSPRKDESNGMYWRHSGDDEDDAAQRNVPGILIDADRLIVLANLKPRITARLEKIDVFPSRGEPISGTFAGSLADYGCLIATLDRPSPNPLRVPRADIRDTRDQLLLGADVSFQGENRLAYFGHRRIPSFATKWKGRIYPELSGDDANLFLFDRRGALLTLPMTIRQKVAEEQSWRSPDVEATPTDYLLDCLANKESGLDSNNVPLTEERESRLAWLGVELQGLNRELARANGVSDLTEDGQSGALVSYVYPDSPAMAAGIEQGHILLRIHDEDQPKPIEISESFDSSFSMFPWERMDEIPEEYFDQLPSPWPSVENTHNRALTDLGFGKRVRIEYFDGNERKYADAEVTEGPPHYESAARFKSESLGMSVRDLTYEVRRYFQIQPDEPGVIVSRLEPGSKASVAGIRPYEIVMRIDNMPVTNVQEFEEMTARSDELRFTIKRMSRSRIVRIKNAGVQPIDSESTSLIDNDQANPHRVTDD